MEGEPAASLTVSGLPQGAMPLPGCARRAVSTSALALNSP